MGKLKELSPLERPREKALRHGINHLSNSELLALIIASGYKGVSALEVGEQLLVDSGGLLNLLTKHVKEISRFKGVGNITALKVGACLEIAKRCIDLRFENNNCLSSDAIFQKYYWELANSEQEVVVLIIFNKMNKVTYENIVYRGDNKNVCLDEKFICNQVILHKGKYFYILHNHPHGHLSPSKEDLVTTGKLVSEANKRQVILLDHLIVTKNGYYSFKFQKSIIKFNELVND